MSISPTRTLSKIVLAAAVAVSSLFAFVGSQAPASAQGYYHHGYGPGYSWHGRHWHHRRWHPGYYGPYHRWHAGFWVYF